MSPIRPPEPEPPEPPPPPPPPPPPAPEFFFTLPAIAQRASVKRSAASAGSAWQRARKKEGVKEGPQPAAATAAGSPGGGRDSGRERSGRCRERGSARARPFGEPRASCGRSAPNSRRLAPSPY